MYRFVVDRFSVITNSINCTMSEQSVICYLAFNLYIHVPYMFMYILLFYYVHGILYTLLYTCTFYYVIMCMEFFTRYYVHVHVHVHIERSLIKRMTIIRSADTTENEYSKFVCVCGLEPTYFQFFPFLVKSFTLYAS